MGKQQPNFFEATVVRFIGHSEPRVAGTITQNPTFQGTTQRAVIGEAIRYAVRRYQMGLTDVAGFSLAYSEPVGRLKLKGQSFYFAECAADILTPKRTKQILNRLKKTPGDDAYGRNARNASHLLEEAMDSRKEVSRFLLQDSKNGGVVDRIIRIEPHSVVVDRMTGQQYFPKVPKASKKVPTGTAP